jgi:hypothetical protein
MGGKAIVYTFIAKRRRFVVCWSYGTSSRGTRMIFIRHSIICTTCLKLMPSLLASRYNRSSIHSLNQGVGISPLMKTNLWRVTYLFLRVMLNDAWRFLLCYSR